jgi:hypothetical protein
MKASEIGKLITRAILLFLILLLTGMKALDAISLNDPNAPTSTEILASMFEDEKLEESSRQIALETKRIKQARLEQLRQSLPKSVARKKYEAAMRKQKASPDWACTSGVAMLWTKKDGSSGGHVFTKNETHELIVMGKLIGPEEFEKMLDQITTLSTKEAVAMLEYRKQKFIGEEVLVAKKRPPKKFEKGLDMARKISYSPSDDEVRLNLLRKNY